MKRAVWLSAGLTACAGVRPIPAGLVDDPVALAKALLTDDGAQIYAQLATPSMLAAFPEKGTRQLFNSVREQDGPVVKATLLACGKPGPLRDCSLRMQFERGAELLTLDLTAEGQIAGFTIGPWEPGPADDYRTQTAYGLPVRGEWTVVNGGPTKAFNGHVGNAQQWYGYDLVMTDAKGESCSAAQGSPRNPDCLAFGQDVLAPADGTVVMAVDGVPDNAGPGEQDGYFVPGNAVEIDHGSGEYSFLCHFEPGTIAVRKGQRVAKGEPLGKVGNSGNSSEPHVHWHLASDPAMWKGHGLPIRFIPLQVNGQRDEAPNPVRGDHLAELPVPSA